MPHFQRYELGQLAAGKIIVGYQYDGAPAIEDRSQSDPFDITLRERGTVRIFQFR